MRKIFRGVAVAAICGAMFFGFNFDKVEASENLDADLNITAEDTDLKSIHIIFGPPPGHRPPPPPPRRPAPPPSRHRYDPPPRHHHPAPPPPHRPGPPPRR